MKILCICHANICRSFMAQEFLKQLLPGVNVFSRGLYADPTYNVPQKVVHALQMHNIKFEGHTATPLRATDLQESDLIFCMEKLHLDFLLDRYPQHTDKMWLLADFASGKEQDLVDPISFDGRVFDKFGKQLYQVCQDAAAHIQHDFSTSQEEQL